MSFKCLKESTSTQQSLHWRNRKMNSISMALDESCKWQRTEIDNRSNIAPPCHQCFHILCPRAVSEHFFILFPPPASLVCETPPSLHTRAHPLNLQPAESTWKQFSFNQVHYKSPSDANLSNTTILFFCFFFSQLHPLYWFLYEQYEMLFTSEREFAEFIALSGQMQIVLRCWMVSNLR